MVNSDLRQKSTIVCYILQNPFTHCSRCISVFFISSHCDVYQRSFSESGEGWIRVFFTFSIMSTGNQLLFSLNEISRKRLEIVYVNKYPLNNAFLQQSDLSKLGFQHHCCKPSKFYFLYNIFSFTSKMWKPPIMFIHCHTSFLSK